MARPLRTVQPDQDEQAPLRSRSSKEENVFSGAMWMVGITLVLFFLPLINGFIGGVVGGYKVGSVKRALLAALIPAVAVALGLWALLVLLDLPVIGFVAGAAVGGVIILSDLGIFIGAAAGGYASEKKKLT